MLTPHIVVPKVVVRWNLFRREGSIENWGKLKSSTNLSKKTHTFKRLQNFTSDRRRTQTEMVWSCSVSLRSSINLPDSSDTNIRTKIHMSAHRGCSYVEPVGVEGSKLVGFRRFHDFHHLGDLEFGFFEMCGERDDELLWVNIFYGGSSRHLVGLLFGEWSTPIHYLRGMEWSVL